jgi:hypothetical protein
VHSGLDILRFSFFEKLPDDPDTQLQLRWGSAGAGFSFLESVAKRKAARGKLRSSAAPQLCRAAGGLFALGEGVGGAGKTPAATVGFFIFFFLLKKDANFCRR